LPGPAVIGSYFTGFYPGVLTVFILKKHGFSNGSLTGLIDNLNVTNNINL